MASTITSTAINKQLSIKDPFAGAAREPWEQLDMDNGDGSPVDAALPVPEITPEVARSIDNADDAVISSSDPAACEFLLTALAFQEHCTPLVTVAVGAEQSRTEAAGIKDKADGGKSAAVQEVCASGAQQSQPPCGSVCATADQAAQ